MGAGRRPGSYLRRRLPRPRFGAEVRPVRADPPAFEEHAIDLAAWGTGRLIAGALIRQFPPLGWLFLKLALSRAS